MKDVFWWWKSVFYVWVVCWNKEERERENSGGGNGEEGSEGMKE